MGWVCMAASGTGSLLFIDDVTADRSSGINSEVYRSILSPCSHSTKCFKMDRVAFHSGVG